MTGFNKGNPPKDGRYVALIKWHEGCNIDDFEYCIDCLYFINGTWYEFYDGGQTIDGGLDYDILGWREQYTGKVIDKGN